VIFPAAISQTHQEPGSIPHHPSSQLTSSGHPAQSGCVRRTERRLPNLSIPQRIRDGLVALGTLPEDCFQSLFKSLKEALPADTAKDLASRIESEFPDSSRKSIERIISAIASAQNVQKTSHVDVEEFTKDVLESLGQDSLEAMKGIDSARFAERLRSVVSETDIQLTTSKINQLKHATQRAMCGAKIITDVRPAFAHDASKPPRAMTVVHTLQLRYHDDAGNHREFYVSLDDNDLRQLGEAVERAKTKKETLKGMLGGANFQVLD
jgi:hypothetical protein